MTILANLRSAGNPALPHGGRQDDEGDGELWCVSSAWRTWRRPTLPRLEAQYHGRCGVSRPSSGWDRVGHPRLWATRSAKQKRASVNADQHGKGCPSARLVALRLFPITAKLVALPLFPIAARLVALRLGWGMCCSSIERLGPVSCACRHASTPGLSTWWSSTALERGLVARKVSRLDAFSGYPVRT